MLCFGRVPLKSGHSNSRFSLVSQRVALLNTRYYSLLNKT